MDAKGKTESLSRCFLEVSLLIPNEFNPNQMTDREFNMLYDNIGKVGLTDPVLVRPHPEQPTKFRVIGGHHRLEVAKLHGITSIPCTVITDPTFDDDQEKFQLVRHNVIHGKMSAQKFMDMYTSLAEKHGQEVLMESFGFTNEEEFNKLIKQTAKTLPKDMQKNFQESAKELKTIDQLSSLLNKMFSTHGDTLDWGYMVVDFGGKDSIWLRMAQKDRKAFNEIALKCKNAGVAVDVLMSHLFVVAAKSDTYLEGILANLPKLEGVDLTDIDVPTLNSVGD